MNNLPQGTIDEICARVSEEILKPCSYIEVPAPEETSFCLVTPSNLNDLDMVYKSMIHSVVSNISRQLDFTECDCVINKLDVTCIPIEEADFGDDDFRERMILDGYKAAVKLDCSLAGDIPRRNTNSSMLTPRIERAIAEATAQCGECGELV